MFLFYKTFFLAFNPICPVLSCSLLRILFITVSFYSFIYTHSYARIKEVEKYLPKGLDVLLSCQYPFSKYAFYVLMSMFACY